MAPCTCGATHHRNLDPITVESDTTLRPFYWILSSIIWMIIFLGQLLPDEAYGDSPAFGGKWGKLVASKLLFYYISEGIISSFLDGREGNGLMNSCPKVHEYYLSVRYLQCGFSADTRASRFSCCTRRVKLGDPDFRYHQALGTDSAEL